MLASQFHRTLPPIQRGPYPMPPLFSVVLPVARTNIVLNGSVETNTTGYTAVGGSIARSTVQQYHGAYSLAVTPGAGTVDGVYYGTVSLTAGQLYAASCKILGVAGRPYKILVSDNAGASVLAVYNFTGTGRWQWVWVYYLETASTTRRIYINKNNLAHFRIIQLIPIAQFVGARPILRHLTIDIHTNDRTHIARHEYPRVVAQLIQP